MRLTTGRTAALLACSLALLMSPARAAELPQRKPGLWETRAVIDGRPRTMKKCFRPGDRSAFLDSVDVYDCKRSLAQVPAGYLLQAECRVRNLILLGRMQIAGDFHYELKGGVKTTVREDRPGAPVERTAMTFSSRFVGECPE